ncbi:hypothetical protein SAMN04488542_13616 [Fontibacillus panacisegetis]|uniref:Uncharacterized protein n=1 Tax=Fontibacillus panacisegetis TaxID=670482 RepID=A0A1G7TD34_9BACL|nr:DUF6155 family protein [Fontibacillus panacisegetis]SDG33012.1 hypothetical protein SAMN04488542_13616 [Fontibacillus panacisegetis]
MPKLRNSTIKKHLNNLTKEELEAEVLNLAKKYPIIQEHYFSVLFPDQVEVLSKYKKIIEKEFGYRKGEILRYPIIKKAIKDFSNVSNNKEQIAEIMVFTVECGVDFTLSFGDIGQKFYHTIASIYEQALKHIVDNQLEEKFVDRCNKLMQRSLNIGWGFGFDMIDLYSVYLGHMDEEDLE